MKLISYIAVALLALAAFQFLLKRGESFGKKRAYLMIFCSMLFFCSAFAGGEAFFMNVGIFWTGGPYSAEITLNAPSFTLPLNGTGEITLNVKNTGSLVWDSDAEDTPVFLSWHLMSEKGVMIRFDNPRTPFSRPIKPGNSESVVVRVSPALEGIPAGSYIIEFDLVCENVAWFADRGSATSRVSVEVLP